MRRAALAALGTLSFLGLVGVSCGGGSTADNGTGGGAGVSSTGSSGTPGSGGGQSSDDASTGNTGGSTSAGGSGPGTGGGNVTDAAQISDVTCSNATAFETFGIMVAQSTGDAAADPDAGACGSKANPCTTIQAGIDAAAKAAKQYVYIAAGTYNEDNITLAKGVSVTGGWNIADWTRGCPIDAGATTIRNVAGTKVITAVDLGGAAALDSVTLKSKLQSAVGTTAAGDGETLYGVFAKGATTSLTLANVKIELANGGRGANGGAAADPAAAPATPGVCPANTTPATMAGGVGSDGLGAIPASFGSDGFVSAAGKDGTAGLMGGDGSSVAGTKNLSCGVCGYSGSSDQPTCSASIGYVPNQAGAGKQGCGGNGGGGGFGGRGGGSSIAIYASAAHLDIQASQLLPGAGGGGGDGSSGKAGGAGSAGATGDPAYCYNTCCWGTPIGCSLTIMSEPAISPNAVCNPLICQLASCHNAGSYATLAGGTATGGANGGLGGKGGGGSGGDSYAIVKVAGAVVTQAGTTLTHGAVGTGGTGANMGAVGTAGDVFE